VWLSGAGRQLPEDFVTRGLVWSPYYLADDFFEGQVVDEDERTLELPSHASPRTERSLHIGAQLAAVSDPLSTVPTLTIRYDRWLTYNSRTKMFSAAALAKNPQGGSDAYTSEQTPETPEGNDSTDSKAT
jgi:hypothetical protein